MAQKRKSKTTDTTPKRVKNTKTEVAAQSGPSLRWYHVAATVVVLGLAVMAIITIFARFDMSLFGSEYTLKYTAGCTTTIGGPDLLPEPEYRYAGIKEGDYIGTEGVTHNLDEAFIEIVELGDNKVKIKTRNFQTNEWTAEELRYGTEKSVTTELVFDCIPAISFTISR